MSSPAPADIQHFLIEEARILDERRWEDWIVVNATIEGEEDGAVKVRSKFQLTEYRRDKQRYFAGTLWHVLEPKDDSFLIRSKKVELVNCDSMMDGLTVPF